MTPPRSKPPVPAEVVTLSPSTEAVIYGPGRVRLLGGREAWYLSEREMIRLVPAWIEFERRRRARVGLDPFPPALLGAAETPSTGGDGGDDG